MLQYTPLCTLHKLYRINELVSSFKVFFLHFEEAFPKVASRTKKFRVELDHFQSNFCQKYFAQIVSHKRISFQFQSIFFTF